MIQAITFDLEGTIVNLDDLHIRSWLEVAREELGLDLTLDSAIEQMPYFIGGGDQYIADQFAAKSGRDAKELLDLKWQRYQPRLDKADVQPREGFLPFLQSLQEANYPVAIGSLTADDKAWHLLRASGLQKYFDINNIVLRNQVVNIKPAADVYVETARRLSVTPDQQLVFEDSVTGVTAAQAAGSPVIAMPVYPQTKPGLLKAGAIAVYDSWKAVTLESVSLLERS